MEMLMNFAHGIGHWLGRVSVSEALIASAMLALAIVSGSRIVEGTHWAARSAIAGVIAGSIAGLYWGASLGEWSSAVGAGVGAVVSLIADDLVSVIPGVVSGAFAGILATSTHGALGTVALTTPGFIALALLAVITEVIVATYTLRDMPSYVSPIGPS